MSYLTFYNEQGRPIAWLTEDTDYPAIYLFNGKPVAWIAAEGVFSYSGKYLGWFKTAGYVIAGASRSSSRKTRAAVPHVRQGKHVRHALHDKRGLHVLRDKPDRQDLRGRQRGHASMMHPSAQKRHGPNERAFHEH